jgi:hypothetical protein
LKAKIQKDKGNFKRNRRYWSFIRTLIESPEGLVEGQIGVTSPEFLFQCVNDETKNLKQVSDDSDAPVPGTKHQQPLPCSSAQWTVPIMESSSNWSDFFLSSFKLNGSSLRQSQSGNCV